MDVFRRVCIVVFVLGAILPSFTAVYLDYRAETLAETYRGILAVHERNPQLREFTKKDLDENSKYRDRVYKWEMVSWHLAGFIPVSAIITYISGYFIVFGLIRRSR